MFETDLATETEVAPDTLHADEPAPNTPDQQLSEPPTMSNEELDELVEAAVQVSCVESAARLQLVELIARLDAAGVWRADGQRCLANWIALRFAVSLRTAREIAAVAGRIGEL